MDISILIKQVNLPLFIRILSLVNTCSILKFTVFHFIILRTNKSYLSKNTNLIIGLFEGKRPETILYN